MCIHHIVSAMALSHRTYPSFISAMSSRLGLSPKCVQLVMMWFRSHVAAPHMYSFCCPGSPTDVSLPGWQPVPSALGWMSAMHATAACDHSGVVLLGRWCTSLDYGLLLAYTGDANKTANLKYIYKIALLTSFIIQMQRGATG